MTLFLTIFLMLKRAVLQKLFLKTSLELLWLKESFEKMEAVLDSLRL